MLRWAPDAFWTATPYEFSCAYVGFAKAKGVGKWSKSSSEIGGPWTAQDVRRVRASISRILEENPDGPAPKDIRRRLKVIRQNR